MTETSYRPVEKLILSFRKLFYASPDDARIGSILVKKGIISEDQLQQTINLQKKELFELGKTTPLGQLIVKQGFTTEQNVVKAFNEYYNLSISSLSENIRGLVKKIGYSIAEESKSTRIPIWLQLSIATMLVLAVSITTFGYIILERQKDKLYDQTIKLGMVSLNYFSNNAKIPLLNDDILALNTLINDAESVDGHFYAFIIDNDRIIKAHTNHEEIDKTFKPFTNVEKIDQIGDVTYFNYTSPQYSHVLNLSTPIVFQDKKLGEVHVGLSIDFVRELFITERAFLAASTLVIILLGMVVAVIFSRRFSKPISVLVGATSEIAKGHYDYKVKLDRNDELGSLGRAFNRMGNELYRQSLMKESFGKYVGPEVLDMIMRSPEKGWLKGRKNEASILFADIRGFTAYSESREPEVVVEKLNEFFEIATDTVMKHGGYVDKFMGDAVLAVFGVPIHHSNHSQRCIDAALDMQKELARAASRKNPLLKSVGIGIATGVLVAGNIGSQIKTEYTVIGDCVNVASYLNRLAGPGEIIVGNGIAEKVKENITLEAMAPQKVKGKEELVEIYRIRPSQYSVN